MKLDLDPQLFNAVISLLQEVSVPHKVVDPVIRALVAQSHDAKVQSLAYPGEPQAVPAKPRRGRPPKTKTNGHTGENVHA